MTVGGVTTSFTYDTNGRLTASGGNAVTYDTAGRTKTYAGWFFEYDPEVVWFAPARRPAAQVPGSTRSSSPTTAKGIAPRS